MSSVEVHNDSSSSSSSGSNSNSNSSSSSTNKPADTLPPSYYWIISEDKDTEGRDIAIMPADPNSYGVKKVVLAVLNYYDENQLWEKRATDKTNTFVFVHKLTGECISISSSSGDLFMTTIDHAQMNATLTNFTVREVAGHKMIDSLDGSQHIVLGYSGHHPGDVVQSAHLAGNTMLRSNLCWGFVEDTSSNLSVDEFEFDFSQKSVKDMQPMTAQLQHVVNELETDQTQTVEFSYDVIETYSFTDQTGLKVTTSLEFKAEFPGISATAGVSVENSAVYSTTKEQQTKRSVKYTIPVKVPPRSSVAVESVIKRGIVPQKDYSNQQGQIDIPYKLKGSKKLPNGKVQQVETHGIFQRVASGDIDTYYHKAVSLDAPSS